MTSPFPIANGSAIDNERTLTENIVALLSSARTDERRLFVISLHFKVVKPS